MKLSIIIPVYRVEDYITQCLNGCISQGDMKLGKDYEIICVDDGSPDNSAAIITQFAKDNYGIRLLRQENQGLSAARNTGLQAAIGEYVWFVDSDDWIDSDCLSKIVPYLQEDLDLLEIQYRNVYENEKQEEGERPNVLQLMTGEEATIMGGVHTPAQFSIYRRSFLIDNKLEFYRGIYHEDIEFKPRALLLAKKVISAPFVCYNYLQRSDGSITARFKKKNGYDMIIALNSLYTFVEKYSIPVKKAIYTKISMWMNSLFSGINQLDRKEYAEIICLLKKHKELLFSMKHANKITYKVEGFLLALNMDFGVWALTKINSHRK